MKHLKLILSVLLLAFVFNTSAYSQNNYRALYADSKLDDIEKLSRERLLVDDTSVDDFYWLSFVLHEKGVLVESIEVLTSGVKKFSNSDVLKKQLANYYYDAGNYSHAKKYFLEYSNDFVYAMKLCEIYEIYQDYAAAVKLLIPLSKTHRNNVVYIKHLAYNYYKLMRDADAELYYLIALDMNPMDQSVASKLVSLYNKKQAYKQSLEVSDNILKRDSLNTMFMRFSGFANLKLDKHAKAYTIFKRLYTMGDSSAYVLKHLGVAEMKTERPLLAQKHLYKAHLRDTTDFQLCYFLGTTYFETENKEDGLKYLTMAFEGMQPPTSTISVVYRSKAKLYLALKDFNNAVEMYSLSYKSDKNPRDLFSMASVYETDLKNYKMALDYFSLFVEKVAAMNEEKKEDSSPSVSLTNVAKLHIQDLKKEIFLNSKQYSGDSASTHTPVKRETIN
jgi:tetratricopeptide (TPR) repeat protein